MKKTLLYIIMALTLISSVSASSSLLDGILFFSNFSGSGAVTDATGNYTFDQNGGSGEVPTEDAACMVGTCQYHDGDNDQWRLDQTNLFQSLGQERTVALWFRANASWSGAEALFRDRSSSGIWQIRADSGEIGCGVYDGSYYWAKSGGIENVSEWTHIACVYNGTNTALFINGAYITKTSDTGPIQWLSGTDNRAYFGTGEAEPPDSDYTGSIDEIYGSLRALEDNEIYELYDNGLNGTSYPFEESGPPAPPVTTDTLYIYAHSKASGSSINNFNATIEGNQTYGTTTGFINVTLNSTVLYNLSVFSSNHINIINYTDHNISENINSSLIQAVLYLNAKEWDTDTTINSFNTTSDFSFNTTTTGETYHYVDAGVINITGKSAGYGDLSTTFIINALDNTTQNITFSRQLNISVINLLNDAIIPNFTVTILNLNDSSSRTNNTADGYLIYPVVANTYNVSVTADGYDSNETSQIITINGSKAFTNLQFEFYTANSFDITFIDESTLEIINTTTVYLDLISDLYANNYSTSNGSLYIDLLTPTTYTFRYYGAGFQPRLSDFTLTNGSYNVITLYLLQGGANVSLLVYDTDRQPVEDATIKIYRYSTASNSYILINTINTNFEGEALVNMELSSEFYRFYVYYNGDLKLSTAPAYVTGTQLVFTITLDDPVLEDYFTTETEYTYSCQYTPSTNNFKFYYDTDGEASKGCLYVYSITPTGETLFNSSCVSSPSSTILVTANNITNTQYIARAYITVSGQDSLICSDSTEYKQSLTPGDYQLGIIVAIFLILVFLFLAYWSLPMAFIFVPLALIFTMAIGLINIPVGYGIGLLIVGIILSVITSGGR